MKSIKALLVSALVLVFAAPAYAETQNVKVSGSIDAYSFYRSNYDLADNNDAGSVTTADSTGAITPPAQSHSGSAVHRSEGDAYFMSITQVGVNADLTDNVSTVINLVNQRDWNADAFGSGGGLNPSLAQGATISNGEFDVILDLAYVQMKEIFYAPLTLTIGRQDLLFGRGFIVGWNPQDPEGSIQADEFTQVQSFDALRATLDFNPWTIDLVYSKLNENSHNPEDDRDLYIANVNYKFAEYNAVAELYYVGETDKATLAGSAGTKNNDTHTFGGRVQFDPISQITLGAELAYQGGDYRSTVTSAGRDREAIGADIFGEYRFDNPWKSMLGLQYVYLSGESITSTGTTDSYGAWNGAFRGPIYGWIHDYKEVYYSTGQVGDQPAGQNLQHISIYGSMNPVEDLKLTANFWIMNTPEDVHIAGTPASSTLDEDLGQELDLAAIYSYTEDVTFTFMADWYFPGDHYNAGFDETASQYVTEVKVVF